MNIEIAHIYKILFHDIDLVLLLAGHLDVDDSRNELLRLFAGDEHLLEIDHLLCL